MKKWKKLRKKGENILHLKVDNLLSTTVDVSHLVRREDIWEISVFLDKHSEDLLEKGSSWDWENHLGKKKRQ